MLLCDELFIIAALRDCSAAGLLKFSLHCLACFSPYWGLSDNAQARCGSNNGKASAIASTLRLASTFSGIACIGDQALVLNSSPYHIHKVVQCSLVDVKAGWRRPLSL